MKRPGLDLLLLFLICFNVLSRGKAESEQVTFYLHNKCSFPVWPATAPNTGHPVIADGGFYLPSNSTRHVSAPTDWNGRIWARTGCGFESRGKPACETGDCGGRFACNGLIGTPPATLVEVSLQADKGKPNFYDVSLVDGYNLPVSIMTRQTSQKCTVLGCSKDLNSLCPDELQVRNEKGDVVVACKSPCLSFNSDNFCCRNEFDTPDKCRPSVYSKIFKDTCPNYVSYAFDSSALRSCSSKEFVITFCPANLGGGILLDEA